MRDPFFRCMSEMPLPPEDDSFHVDVAEDGPRAVISLHGELDLLTADRVEAALDDLYRRKRVVVLDLRGLTFMDSSAIRLLVTFDAISRNDGVTLYIVRAPEKVHRVLDITGVAEHLALVDDPGDVPA